MLSSRNFIVSGVPFKSLIHSELIFVYGVKRCYSFILLHRACCTWSTVFPIPLVEEAIFFPCIYLPLLSKIRYP